MATREVELLVGPTQSSAPSVGTPTADDDVITKGYFDSNVPSGTSLGLINYINNSTFEDNVTGWATYADAAASVPVDGTSGSPSVTFTRDTTASNIIRGIAVGKLAKDASNRQGEGVSNDFSIDEHDQGNNIQIQFEYKSAGTFAAADIIVAIYDKTNAALITVGNPTLSGTEGKHCAGFVAAANSTEYRLILHVASTSSSSYDFLVDSFAVEPVFKSPKVISFTADATIDASLANGNFIFNNNGATGAVSFTLPAAVAGCILHFQNVESTLQLGLIAASGDKITIVDSGLLQSSDARTLEFGATVKLMAKDATDWISIVDEGTWQPLAKAYLQGGSPDGVEANYLTDHSLFDSTFTAKTAMLTATAAHRTGAVGAVMYKAGGRNSSGTQIQDCDSYTADTDAWSAAPNDLPSPGRKEQVIFDNGSQNVHAGGRSPTFLTDVDSFDGTNWTSKTSFTGTAFSNGQCGNMLLAGKGYLNGGDGDPPILTQHFEYDFSGSGTWTSKSTTSYLKKAAHATFTIDGSVGYSAAGNDSGAQTSIQSYTQATDTWSAALTAMTSTARTAMGTYNFNSEGYVAGGSNLDLNTSYEPVGDAWTARTTTGSFKSQPVGVNG